MRYEDIPTIEHKTGVTEGLAGILKTGNSGGPELSNKLSAGLGNIKFTREDAIPMNPNREYGFDARDRTGTTSVSGEYKGLGGQLQKTDAGDVNASASLAIKALRAKGLIDDKGNWTADAQYQLSPNTVASAMANSDGGKQYGVEYNKGDFGAYANYSPEEKRAAFGMNYRF